LSIFIRLFVQAFWAAQPGSRGCSAADFTSHAVNLRRFKFGDEPALFRVFHSAVHIVAARHYTPEQVVAWAPDDLDPELWGARMRSIAPFVVEAGDEIVGYADVQVNGYIDHFFVSGWHQRQGIGAMLMQRIHAEAAALDIRQLTSDVSRTAEPFFSHYGFAVVERRFPERRGVVIPNTFMQKALPPGAGGA
jgi:putative acetyltransferase